MRTFRVIVTAAAALAVVAVAPGQAAASHPQLIQPFFADAGSICFYGYTEGDLSFTAAHPPEPVVVTVAGRIEDNPTPPPGTICPAVIDDRHTVATFVAHNNDVIVDYAMQTVDDGVAEFEFTLDGTPSNIDLVTVQVCRVPNDPDDGGSTICGEISAYYPDGSTKP